MKQMKAKVFSILIICVFVISAIVLASSLYLTSKLFDDKSYDWKKGIIHNVEPLLREEKSMYIGQKNIDYNAYVLGGSKAGFLKKNTLDYFSGKNYYNFFSTSGGFRDYKLYADFLIDKHGEKINEIILHLSTYETVKYAYSDYIPVSMQKNIVDKCSSIANKFTKFYLNIDLFTAYIKKRISNNFDFSITQNGEYEMSKSIINFEKDPEKYISKNVTMITKQNRNIKELFSKSPIINKEVCKKNIRTLKELKTHCDENDIKLKIVIGAHFINRLSNLWGEDFDNYLRDLISVNGEIWNFCGINEVNMNPYNFFNDGHFWFFVGDKMIEKMYSPLPNTTDMDAFGILLTKDNVDQYIESQHQKWLKLKAEYEATGTVKLYEMDDPSYLGTVITK